MIGRHRAGFDAIAAGVVDGENHDWFVVVVMKMDCSRLQDDLERGCVWKHAEFSGFLTSEKKFCVA